jgi:hypothetical protein
MDFALDPKSPTGKIFSADDWHVKRREEEAACILCGGRVKRRPAHGQGKVHFYHLAGSACPSIDSASERYNLLKGLPTDKSLAPANRAYVFENLVGVHKRMRKHLGTISFQDILSMCKVAEEREYWSLKGLSREMLPYMLLTCMDQFPPLGNRLFPVYFVIQPPPGKSFFWNFPAGHARHILFVNANNPSTVFPEVMDLSAPIEPMIEQLRKLLTEMR